jgi:pimeloyl-ACP methyl ester carboxylesterase
MTTFVLIPGAGGTAWYWHRIVPLLAAAGHQAVAVDLPGGDETAGLPEYASTVLAAVRNASDVVLVAQSLGGFTAPLVAGKIGVRGIVFVNAMVPGETPGAWWAATGWEQARTEAAERSGYGTRLDLAVYFLHDVPPEVAVAGEPYQRPEADVVFGSVCDFGSWPAVPIRAVAGAGDRFFPADFQRGLARDRLGIEADVLPGGHLIALSQPDRLAAYLLAS